jgi:branched chain amino acid efflux pump
MSPALEHDRETICTIAQGPIVSTVGQGQDIVIDARLVGLVVAGLALWRRAPFVVVILLASAATALTRLVT